MKIPPLVGPGIPGKPMGPVKPVGPRNPVEPVGPVPRVILQSVVFPTGISNQLLDNGSPISLTSQLPCISLNFFNAV